MSLLQGIIDKKHILLLGVPRTGSTWLGKILSQTWDYSYVHEPDNERHTFHGYYAKQGLPRFPMFSSKDENRAYLELFQLAFHQPYITYDSTSNQILKKWVSLKPELVEQELQQNGVNPRRNLKLPYIFSHLLPKQLGNRNNRVVKSVHAVLAADFLFNHFPEVQPLFIIRHPAAVVASLLRMNNEDIDRKLYLNEKILDKHSLLKRLELPRKPLEFRAGVQVAIFYHEIAHLLSRYPKSKLVQFEALANYPFQVSHDLYSDLNMKWTDDVELFIANSNRKGTGYETRRETKRQATKWKNELQTDQIRLIADGYQSLGEPKFYAEF